jgi:type III protein arginine methyltransferase
VLLHWELTLFGDITYSTAPGRENWQDHWLTIIAPLPTVHVAASEEITLSAFYDDTSLWFTLASGPPSAKRSRTRPAEMPAPTPTQVALYDDNDDDDICGAPACGCGWHTLCTAQRLIALTDMNRNSALRSALQAGLARMPPDTACVDISDGSLCALMLSKMQAAHVVSVEAKPFARLLADQLVSANQFDERMQVTDAQCWTSFSADALDGRPIGLLCAEPFFFQVRFMGCLM